MEIQKVRFLQGEHLGKPVENIDGQKPPNKVNLGKEFLKDQGKKFITDVKREFISNAAKKSKVEIDIIKNEVQSEIQKIKEL